MLDLERRPPRLAQGLVRAYMGLPGQGKTYTMVRHAQQVRKRWGWLPVYSNFPVRLPGNGPVLPLDTVDRFEAARNGLVLVDEAHTLLGAREWNGKDRNRVLTKLGQMRKAGLYFWYTTHSPEKVDKQLRLLTEECYRMENMKTLTGAFMYIRRAGVEPGAPKTGYGVVLFSKRTCEAYDTTGAVASTGLAAW